MLETIPSPFGSPSAPPPDSLPHLALPCLALPLCQRRSVRGLHVHAVRGGLPCVPDQGPPVSDPRKFPGADLFHGPGEANASVRPLVLPQPIRRSAVCGNPDAKSFAVHPPKGNALLSTPFSQLFRLPPSRPRPPPPRPFLVPAGPLRLSTNQSHWRNHSRPS